MIGLSLLSACHPPPTVEVEVDELQPLEDNRAPLPDPTGDEQHPEALSVVSGGENGLWWAHGRGYIRADVAAVWAAARDPDVDVDRREVDEWTVTDDPRPTLDASYRIHCTVHDVLTVDYELWWRHELQEGEPAAPERAVSRWDKTDGTTFINLLSGSLVLSPVDGDAGVTEVALIEWLDATMRDDETIASYLRDLHASLAAGARGEPLPTW